MSRLRMEQIQKASFLLQIILDKIESLPSPKKKKELKYLVK